MSDFCEIVRIPEGALAWVYLFSENNIEEVSNHWHQSLELTLICKGQANYTINGHTFYPKQGELILVNCGDLHKCNIPSGRCEGINIMIPNRYLIQFAQGKDMILFKLDSENPDYIKLVRRCEKLYHVFAMRNNDPYAQMQINSLISDIMYLLLTSFRWDEFSPHSIESKKYRKRCREIIEFIDDVFKDDISMQTLVDEFGISKEHLARIFRDYMGTTFKKHLTRTRMYHAYKLLTNSDLTIIQIAVDSGFSDSRAFISFFQKLYGTTPGRYRREYYQNLQISSHDAAKHMLFFPEVDIKNQ